MAVVLSALRRLYLSLYNWTVFLGWFQVLYLALKTLNESGHQHVYSAVERPLLLAQSAAVLEILHGLVGLVRSPITATLPQIGSRLYLTWGILWSFPETRSHMLVSSLVISWSITEIIRYSFFGMKEALGFAPSWLLWLRYSTFILLYPTGITSEVGLIYIALPHIKNSEKYSIRMPNEWNFSFDYFYAAIVALGIYVPEFINQTCRLQLLRRIRPTASSSPSNCFVVSIVSVCNCWKMNHPDNHVNDNANLDEIVENYNAPLWKYVKKLEKVGNRGGGNTKFECNYCQKTYKGSYSRVKFHLLKMSGNGIAPCNKVTYETLAEMNKLVRECEYKLKSSAPKHVSLPNTGSFCYDLPEANLDPKKRKGTSGPISKAFNKEARDQCDAEVARMFYTGGLSFNLARNPHYRNSYVRASTLPGYVPPGYNALRTTLLQQEKSHIERCLQPIKRTWSTKGVSVCSDGWTDAQRRPLINIMAACESGPMFLRAINCEGEYKDKHCIANFLTEAIKEIGHENVVQVITDNAPVCKAAGLLIEAHYPHIFWTPCVVHTLNLALKSICTPKQTEVSYDDCNWISTIASDAWSIKNFIMNHSMRLSMFNEHCKLKLLSIAETRFASTLVMLRRLKEIKEGLQQMVISLNWALYKEDDLVKAMMVKQKILDEDFWEKIDYVLFFTAPIYEVIRMADTDKPCLHLVYEWWDAMIEKVKAAIYRNERKALHEKSSFFDAVYRILLERWTKSSTPLHCLAHSLNPRYYSSEWLQEDPSRLAPHRDVELTIERKKCFERYFSNEEIRRNINVEYASFSMCLNDFGAIDSMNDRFHLEPVMWWIVHGASTPSLQSIALKLLGQPCSSSCCERNWSTYSFIHSLRRNKITPQRAEDLVFVHNNLRLLSRNSSTYKEGITQLWDVGGDGFENLGEESVGMLEIANLSLDEPSLETTLVTGGDIMNVEVE